MGQFKLKVFVAIVTIIVNFSSSSHATTTTTDTPTSTSTTSSPPTFQVYLYQNTNGTGKYKEVWVNTASDEPTCTTVPENFSVGGVGIERNCIRFWQEENCKPGTPSRCHCDARYLSLDDHFRVSKDASWQGQVRGLSPCLLKPSDQDDHVSLAWLFSQPNFSGNMTTVVLKDADECISFPEGDKWYGYGHSSWLFQGCVEYFTEPDCRGDQSSILSQNQPSLNTLPGVKSIRNCGGQPNIVRLTTYDNRNHGVGVTMYPRGFPQGLPWYAARKAAMTADASS